MDDDESRLYATGFEEALVGILHRCGQPPIAVYDVARCVEILVARDGMTPEEAEEFLEFNAIGAWMGPHTPGWLIRS